MLRFVQNDQFLHELKAMHLELNIIAIFHKL